MSMTALPCCLTLAIGKSKVYNYVLFLLFLSQKGKIYFQKLCFVFKNHHSRDAVVKAGPMG